MGCSGSKTNSVDVDDANRGRGEVKAATQGHAEGKKASTKVKKSPEKNNNLSKAAAGSDEDGLSILSGSSLSSEPSRPPTPFSRPLTARVAVRPRTHTIFEDNKNGQTGTLDARHAFRP